MKEREKDFFSSSSFGCVSKLFFQVHKCIDTLSELVEFVHEGQITLPPVLELGRKVTLIFHVVSENNRRSEVLDVKKMSLPQKLDRFARKRARFLESFKIFLSLKRKNLKKRF